MKRRHLLELAVGLAVGLPMGAGAQQAPADAAAGRAGARRIAVMSIVGDTLDIVTYQVQTGSSLDQNLHDKLPLPDATFDRVAVRALVAAIGGAEPADFVLPLAASSPALYQNQRELFDGGHAALPPELLAAAAPQQVTQLLLVSKHRGEARLQADSSQIGSGMLEGIGFYIDHDKRMTRSDTRETARGFIAPYVYLKLSLIDLATSALLRQHVITAAYTRSAARSKADLQPWNVWTPEQKVRVLSTMIDRELRRAVPPLLAS